MLTLLVGVPLGSSTAPLPCDPHAIVVHVSLTPPSPPSVSAYSSISNASGYLLLKSVTSSALSSRLVTSVWYSPSALSLLICDFGLCHLLITHASVVLVTSLFLFADPVSLLVAPLQSLTPPDLLLLPLSSLGILRLPDPPLTPPPPALAVDISCKDKYVGDHTDGGESHWLVAGGSTPHGKCPSRTLAVDTIYEDRKSVVDRVNEI